MQVTLRFNVPDDASGRNTVRELVDSWLCDEEVSIYTPSYATAVQLTYVKESN
jgi:hypothetical protein